MVESKNNTGVLLDWHICLESPLLPGTSNGMLSKNCWKGSLQHRKWEFVLLGLWYSFGFQQSAADSP